MRIQETNGILKESRLARNAAHQQDEGGLMSRAWRMVSTLPQKITSLFHR